jgi:hypothetical protein
VYTSATDHFMRRLPEDDIRGMITRDRLLMGHYQLTAIDRQRQSRSFHKPLRHGTSLLYEYL